MRLLLQMHGMAIRRNTIQCMQAIIEAIVPLQIELRGEAVNAAARVEKLDEAAELTPEVVKVKTASILIITNWSYFLLQLSIGSIFLIFRFKSVCLRCILRVIFGREGKGGELSWTYAAQV